MGSLRMINMTEQQRPCGSWLAAQNALLQSVSKTEKQTGSYVVIWAGTHPPPAIAPFFPLFGFDFNNLCPTAASVPVRKTL